MPKPIHALSMSCLSSMRLQSKTAFELDVLVPSVLYKAFKGEL